MCLVLLRLDVPRWVGTHKGGGSPCLSIKKKKGERGVRVELRGKEGGGLRSGSKVNYYYFFNEKKNIHLFKK